jgi:peptidoglycan/xylan/chitin deacetylase (PgdA/CDA1 family)
LTAARTAARVLAGAAVGLAAAHAAPAIAAIGPLRRQLLPALAGVGDPGHIALTFDDGPHPESTPHFLRLLDTERVQATFFVLGSQLARYPELGRDIVAGGHEIAVHGHEHRLLLRRGPSATVDDLTRARNVIAGVTGVLPRWWRPPYGVASSASIVAARRLGLTPVLWTCWGRDWTSTATADSVHRRVLRRLAGGGTILLHDSDHAASPGAWRSALDALPRILISCRVRGFAIGPLGEHGVGADRESACTL